MAECTTSPPGDFVSRPEDKWKDPSARRHCLSVLLLPRRHHKHRHSRTASQPSSLFSFHFQHPTFLSCLTVPENQRRVSSIPRTWKPGPRVHHFLSGETSLGGGQQWSFLIRESRLKRLSSSSSSSLYILTSCKFIPSKVSPHLQFRSFCHTWMPATLLFIQ